MTTLVRAGSATSPPDDGPDPVRRPSGTTVLVWALLTLVLGVIGVVVALLGAWSYCVNWLAFLGVIVPQLGAELIGEVAQYEDIYRLCFVRGPEGIIIGLAEQLS